MGNPSPTSLCTQDVSRVHGTASGRRTRTPTTGTEATQTKPKVRPDSESWWTRRRSSSTSLRLGGDALERRPELRVEAGGTVRLVVEAEPDAQRLPAVLAVRGISLPRTGRVGAFRRDLGLRGWTGSFRDHVRPSVPAPPL